MSKGKVKFFNGQKGFGFIQPADGNRDVFVHASGLDNCEIQEGDDVEFEVIDEERGTKAVNVRKL